MIAWLALAATALILLALLVGVWLGRHQSTSTLTAAATVSSMMNRTADSLLKASSLTPAVEQALAQTKVTQATLSRRFRVLRREVRLESGRISATVSARQTTVETSLRSLTTQVDLMGETLTQMLAVFVQRGLIRVESSEGYQAGEVRPKPPPPLPGDAIKNV